MVALESYFDSFEYDPPAAGSLSMKSVKRDVTGSEGEQRLSGRIFAQVVRPSPYLFLAKDFTLSTTYS
jgi:hypothetical protein